MNESLVRKDMQNSLEALTTDMSSIRTGRATPALVESIMVTAYGGAQRMKIMEMASISAQDPQTLTIEPWDKSVIGEIKKGIMAANLGFNPSIDGEIIRISMPPLTGEDREKFVKLLHVKLENARVSIRQIRGDVMREIKKQFESKSISEDDKFDQEKTLQSITDEFIAQVDESGASKEKELRGE